MLVLPDIHQVPMIDPQKSSPFSVSPSGSSHDGDYMVPRMVSPQNHGIANEARNDTSDPSWSENRSATGADYSPLLVKIGTWVIRWVLFRGPHP